jgi:hypothetical protein
VSLYIHIQWNKKTLFIPAKRITNVPDRATARRGGAQLVIYKNSILTSQETHYVSATKLNRLMPFGETVAVY